MKKFWAWMNKNDYTWISDGKEDRIDIYLRPIWFEEPAEIEVDCTARSLDKPFPKQMLVGYMIEYIQQHTKRHTMGDPTNRNRGWGHIIPEDDLGLPGCWNYEALRIAINILDKEG